MKTSTADLLFQIAFFGSVAGLVVFVGLGIEKHWAYFFAAVAVTAPWPFIFRAYKERARRQAQEAFQRAFAIEGIEVPGLHAQGMHGFPHFRLTFSNAAALKRAEDAGCIATFKNSLRSIYGHLGGKRNPFNPDMAVWVDCRGPGITVLLAFADDSTVRMFDNPAQANSFCEAIDVADGLYVFVDGDGFVLTPVFTRKVVRRKFLFLATISGGAYNLDRTDT